MTNLPSTAAIPAFAAALQPLRVDAGALHFALGDDWRQGRSCFGGLQAAMALLAMRRFTGVTAPLKVLQTTFIGPVGDAEVEVRATVLRTGKSVAHVEARLLQGGETRCLVIGVFGEDRPSAIAVPMAVREAPQGPEGLRDLPFAKGVAPNFTQHFVWRWAAGGFPYSASREPFTRIWLKHRGATDASPHGAEIALVGLADAVPSPAISMMRGLQASSSLTWTLELLRPAPPQRGDFGSGHDFWRIDSELHQARDGYAAQTATVVAPDNTPVALSRQSVVVFG